MRKRPRRGHDQTPELDNTLTALPNCPNKWDHLMTVPMRFNRMIIFRPWFWHPVAWGFHGAVWRGVGFGIGIGVSRALWGGFGDYVAT